MKVEFRLPGHEPYSYASIWTSEGSAADNKRELRDLDAEFLSIVGTLLAQGATMAALGPLNGRVVSDDPEWPQESQEGQTYTYRPTAPQGATQSYAGGGQYTPPPAGNPPGQQAQICSHGVPMKYFPAGVSSRTNKPYGASWRCEARVAREQQCKAVWMDS